MSIMPGIEVVTPSPVYTEWLVGDMGIACDYADNNWCCKGKAEWSLFLVCPKCLFNAVRLAGTGCKDLFMFTENLIECSACGEIDQPKAFMHRIEAL